MFNINVSTKSIDDDSVGIELNRQDTRLYNYHNITRLAAIFNNLYLHINSHRTVDEIYDSFLNIADPNVILHNFCKDFKDIYYLYLHFRFQTPVTTAFQETDNMNISPDFPIYTWFSHFTLFTIYSSRHINALLQKCSAFVYIYGIDNLIINREYHDSSKKSFEQIQQERMLSEKTRLISEQLGNYNSTAINDSDTDFCNIYKSRRQQRNQVNGPLLDPELERIINRNKNTFQMINRISLPVNMYGPNRSFVLDNIYAIQKNLDKTHKTECSKHWAYLNIVYYILESAIRPIIEDITREKRNDVCNIHIKFKKRDLVSVGQFNHGNIGEIKTTSTNVYCPS